MKSFSLYIFPLVLTLFGCSENGSQQKGRSITPVMPDVPTVRVDTIPLKDSLTFTIYPQQKGIRLQLSGNPETDTLIADTSALRKFIDVNQLEVRSPRVIMVMKKGIPLEKASEMLDVLRKTGLGNVNFITMP